MELKALKYFKAIVEEGSFTAAAEALHLTQPTLSRQIAQLESELGNDLIIRSGRNTELTENGRLLYSYACQIVGLSDKAIEEVGLPASTIAGCVHIGAGETPAFQYLARAMRMVREKYPAITFELVDGTTADLMDSFVRGAFDFFLECDARSHVELNSLPLPLEDVWGVFMDESDPLAKLDTITARDLKGIPLAISAQGMKHALSSWAKESDDDLDIAATYNLISNARMLAEEKVCYLLGYEGLLKGHEDLCFRPLEPQLKARHQVLWRKTKLTKQAEVFLDALRETVSSWGTMGT